MKEAWLCNTLDPTSLDFLYIPRYPILGPQEKRCASSSSLRAISCPNPVQAKGSPKNEGCKTSANTLQNEAGNPKTKDVILRYDFNLSILPIAPVLSDGGREPTRNGGALLMSHVVEFDDDENNGDDDNHVDHAVAGDAHDADEDAGNSNGDRR